MVTYCENNACAEYEIDKTVTEDIAALDGVIICGMCGHECVPIEQRDPIVKEGRTYDDR
jgi:hypothetical protein